MVEPLADREEDGSGSVGQAEFVVASGQAAPLLHVAVATLDDVAAAAVLLLVARFGDHCLDPATAQNLAEGIACAGMTSI